MSDGRWQRLDDIFHRALELPAEQRERFVVGAAGDDEALGDELRRLLRAHEAADPGFLARPNVEHATANPAAGGAVGPYRILREIGRGGMGTVYLAERSDAQYHKRLAIKLIKPGLDSESVLRRFVAERQILASLDHPNIARLYDGGTTEDGRPYFVMELVEGKPIDEYAASAGLSIEARLQLFRQVCAAVSYAHQHLVIHRDLKPSNILVTADGTAKLLDFGIARILSTDDPDTPSTVTVLGLMTPEFASPEQIRGRHATTASDVYGLGLVLYRLLTGAAPYRFESRSLEEMARVIGDVEPLRPSASGSGSHRLRGDLDNIVLKALQKEPARRYASVDQFSDDIRRHLEGLPVIARPDTMRYRAAKFIRRNRVAVTGAGVVFLTLVGGIVTTAWQARRALEQEQAARAAQAVAERRFQEVRKLARTVLFDYHDLIKDLPGATPVRERLVRDATTYLEGLSREAGTDTGLISELANGYERIGDVQGSTHLANIGNTDGALANYRKALELYEARQALTPRDAIVRRDVAIMHAKLGQLAWQTGDTDAAMKEHRLAIGQLEALVREVPGSDEFWRNLAGCQSYAGLILRDRGEIDAAIDSFNAAIRSYRTCSDQRSESVRRALASEQGHLASALIAKNRLEEALASNGLAVEAWTGLLADFPDNVGHRRDIGVAYYFRGDILARLGRQEEALAAHQRNLEITEQLSKLDPENSLYLADQGYALARVGDVLVDLGRLRPAAEAYERSRVLRQAIAAADSINLWKRATLIECHVKLAHVFALVGDGAPSVRHNRQASSLMNTVTVEPRNALIRGFLADSYADLGEAFARLAADRRTPPGDRPAYWREARERYRRSTDIWGDMQSLGIVDPADATKPKRADEGLARCEAALRRLGQG